MSTLRSSTHLSLPSPTRRMLGSTSMPARADSAAAVYTTLRWLRSHDTRQQRQQRWAY
jgi:hypothetical protein